MHQYIRRVLEIYTISEMSPIGVQTLVNLLHVMSPLLSSPNQHQYLWELIMQGLERPNLNTNSNVRLMCMVIVKRIFIISHHQGFNNELTQ
jgi:hypothetical protein